MFNYIAFLHGGLDKPGERPREDGRALAEKCLIKLRAIDKEQFPPKLLILLVSASYLDDGNRLDEIRARQLLAGVHEAFSEAGHGDMELIGSSVAAVFYDNEIHHEGALLICLASRLLDAKAAIGPHVSGNPDEAVKALLNELDIEHSLDEYPKPLPNRVLLTFFPGEVNGARRTSTDKLHGLLGERLTHRIPIVGGVSSANDGRRLKRGLQFVGRQAFTDALAACLIRTGVALGTSLAKGLEPLRNAPHDVLHVKKLSADRKTIEEFYEGTPEHVLRGVTRPVLLKDLSPGTDLVRAAYLPGGDGRVNVLREVGMHAALELTTPTPRKMFEETERSCQLSLRKAGIKSPIGCLAIKCAGHYRYKDTLHLVIEDGIKLMGTCLNNAPYVGGFFDGEVGTDDSGSSACGNWGVAAMVFGDEISERAAVQGGFSALASHGLRLTDTFDLETALTQALELVCDLGFPGSMISVMMPDQERDQLVPIRAKGSRFEKLFELMRKTGHVDQLFEGVERGKAPIFIPDSRSTDGSLGKLIQESGLIAQYAIPLFDPDERVFAVLRVDLGDPRDRAKIHPAVEEVVKSIAAIVGAAINRIFSWEENRLARVLDKAFRGSLPADEVNEGLQQFIEAALECFKLKMGYVRLVDPREHRLVLKVGTGSYYDAARKSRSEVSFEDWSPSCQAFISEKTTIINDAPNNSAHKRMLERYESDSAMSAALGGLGSYASVPFKNERGERVGTINLLSAENWFFTSYHERALAALQRRTGYLVEHLRGKERAKADLHAAREARRRQRHLDREFRFILGARIRLDEFLSFDDAYRVLGHATRGFSEAMRADAAALYLWDEDQQQYILRAEHGWKHSGWINAARYRKTDDWIGAKGLADRPRYVPNLFRYYDEQGYAEPSGRYATQIFGTPLSRTTTVEAIAAPLKVAGKQIGVLTLYRNMPSTETLQPSGFATTEIRLLEAVTDHFAVLVASLLSHQAALQEQRAGDRRTRLFDVLARQNSDEPFVASVCAQVIDSFGASQVEFYKTHESNNTCATVWEHGVALPRGSVKLRQLNAHSPDEVVMEAINTKSVITLRKKAVEGDNDNPTEAATEGMIERCCIPLKDHGRLGGAVDLRWRTDERPDVGTFNSVEPGELLEIGRMLGSGYLKEKFLIQLEATKRREVESRMLANSVDGLFALSVHQVAHRLRNLKEAAHDVVEASPERISVQNIAHLKAVISDNIQWIERLVSAAHGISHAQKRSLKLATVLGSAMKESLFKVNSRIEFVSEVSDDLFVWANGDAVREVFVNIINNAIEAMPDGGVLTVAAALTESENVRIVLADTGDGMTPEDVELARSTDFTTKQEHDGLGVPISIVAINYQRGTLDIDSGKGRGTRVIINLPSKETEDAE